jgi:predicted RNA-binding Zn ribbon-like protein
MRRVVMALAAEDRAAASLSGPIEELNRFVADAFAHVRLALPASSAGEAGASPTWAWERDADRLDSVLWPIVRRAAELIASDEAGRLRVCPGPSCGWAYVDRSRNGLRRWCEMSTCGTDEKTRRRRARSA